MKQFRKIFYISAAVAAALLFPLYAEETSEPKSPWLFSITTDTAYYPKSDFITGGDHFSRITGAYDALEARATLHAKYTIPVPFGNNAFVKGNTLVIDNALELSPVSFSPMLSVSFTPVAFLVFSAGAKAGAGWNALGIQGMALLNNKTTEYESFDPFTSLFLDGWASAAFQFDAAALWPGDWHHIVMLANYKTEYSCLTGADNGDVWKWLGTGNKANG